MKKFALLSIAVIFYTAFLSPASAADRYEKSASSHQHAGNWQPYLFGQIGMFEPNNSRDGLSGYDTGESVNFGIGSRVSPFLAVEGSLGSFSADAGPDEVTVVPLTFGLRLIIPNPVIEPYVGGGLGLYFADLTEMPTPWFSGIDDSDTTFGGYGSIGADIWFNPNIAFNLEGRYHWAEPTFISNAGNSFDVKVDGWTVNMGIRLSF